MVQLQDQSVRDLQLVYGQLHVLGCVLPKLIAKIKTTVQTAQNFIKQINNILQIFVFQAKATFLKFQLLKWLQSISDTETNDWSKKKKATHCCHHFKVWSSVLLKHALHSNYNLTNVHVPRQLKQTNKKEALNVNLSAQTKPRKLPAPKMSFTEP